MTQYADDCEVAIHDNGRQGNLITSVPFGDVYDALDYASNADTWNLPCIGFMHVWCNGDCVATFYNHAEALAAYETAIGR